jgi:hypothetical protein|tara:strand:+ start:1047 stop:1637 length:591 start_codon:yes stop_codon:yes gene_type:complete
MWELFQKILKANLSPNQSLILFGMKQGISLKQTTQQDKDTLVEEGYLVKKDNLYTMTPQAKLLIVQLDNYFIKAKKKTDSQLMGKNFVDNINNYREIFPAKKLPSGKPARNNVKALGEAFRWFFETYDHTWEEVHKATRMYVNEYRDADYMYMQTSQYFICKQDKHRVKHSTLADYCDMILEGVSTEDDHFKEKVV